MKRKFTKDGQVKVTKSGKLAKILEDAGWKHETSGGASLATLKLSKNKTNTKGK